MTTVAGVLYIVMPYGCAVVACDVPLKDFDPLRELGNDHE